MRRSISCLVVLAAFAVAAPAAQAGLSTEPMPFGHPCAPENGVRYCPTTQGSAGRTTDGVPTFDDIPLDADVTLPATGSGPFPIIVMLHGYGGDKGDFETTTPEGDGKNTYHYNNNFYAKQGYAVLNYTARGFGHSCGGGPAADHTGACANGFLRLADSRYEVRDTQYLVGKLVDENLAKAGAIGVTGISYGGGQSMQLGFLKDRIRNTNGSFSPWVSPDGTPLSITASWPRWPWSDLSSALLPNGRFLDFDNSTAGLSRDPIGVPIQTYVTGLYALGLTSGYYCGAPTPCPSSEFDLSTDFTRVLGGEPFSADTRTRLDEITRDKGAYGIYAAAPSATPSPLLMQSGWTDDLFPPAESLRMYNLLRAKNPQADVSLQFGDLGHSRGSNKPTVNQEFNDKGASFFAAHLKSVGSAPAAGSVEAFTQTCPKTVDTPDGGPFTAASWPSIHPGTISITGSATQTVTAQGDADSGPPFDPVTQLDPAGTTDACRTIASSGGAGTATYERAVTTAFTLLGLPTVTAAIQTSGRFGQLDSRLYDVLPDGSERLITRGSYRLLDNQAGKVTFQLHGNGYRFEVGHKVKLELRGNDANYLRPSNSGFSTAAASNNGGNFSVQVSNLAALLPTIEKSAVKPPTGPPAKPCGRLRLSVHVTPARTRAGQRRTYTVTVTGRRPCQAKAHAVRGALVSFAGRHRHTDSHGHVRLTLTLHRVGNYRVAGHVAGSRTASTHVRSVHAARAGVSPRFTG